MRYYDVFNGDADGICALHQLRLADPLDSIPITGLKRDITLLDSVPAADGDVVTVLDLSLDRNREALEALLERGAVVHYFDHHYAGAIPAHPRLLAVIDTSGASCTSALVDRYLQGRFRAWAVVGAFGDGLDDLAAELARPLALDAARLESLRELGTNLNYGAYGQTAADVLVPPIELYRTVSHYADPFELADREPVIGRLGYERREDLERALALQPLRTTERAGAWMLPDAAWARRVSGTFANRLALTQPHRAHAVLTRRADGGYLVSVRSPRASATPAVDFCRRFPTGGGRVAAAGIDRLEGSRLDEFLDAFCAAWSAREEIPEGVH
jgi:hypothetical protein